MCSSIHCTCQRLTKAVDKSPYATTCVCYSCWEGQCEAGSGASAGEELVCEVMNGEDRLSSLLEDYDFEWWSSCMMPN